MSQNTPPESPNAIAPQPEANAHPEAIARRTSDMTYDVAFSLLRQLQPHVNEMPEMPLETLIAYVDASYRGEY